jgi:Gpi18-like mannosyltransferase
MVRYRPNAEFVLVVALALLALVIRWVGINEVTPDMQIFIKWYGFLEQYGGVHGLRKHIGNYNAPFLYLLVALIYIPGPLVIKIKVTWILFDLLLIFFTYRIVGLRYPGSRRVPALAALIMAFLPTVVINSSFYGQCDNIWAAFSLGGLYYLLRGKDWAGAALFAIAFAFKPQAIFIFPVLGLLIFTGRARWRSLIAIPVTYVLLDVPAMVAGRGVVELLTLYNPVRQSRYVEALTSNAASIFAYLPVDSRKDTLRLLGYAFAAALVLGLAYAVLMALERAGRTLRQEEIVLVAALFSALVPWVLPGMHERYFFLADVLTVVAAFYVPRLWFVPPLMQVASLISYVPFLFLRPTPGKHFIALPVASTIVLIVIIFLGHALIRNLLKETLGPKTPAG